MNFDSPLASQTFHWFGFLEDDLLVCWEKNLKSRCNKELSAWLQRLLVQWWSSSSEWRITHMILTLITSVCVISSFFIPTRPPRVLGPDCCLLCQKKCLVCCYLLKSVKEAVWEPMPLWLCLLLTLVYAFPQTTHGCANVSNVLYGSLSCVWESAVTRHAQPVHTHE